jgi:hypothetical protein
MTVAKDTRPVLSDDELNRALTILDRPAAEEGAVDAAFKTLMSLSPAPASSTGFARSVMLAVRKAPLGEGRRPFAEPLQDWSRVAAFAAAIAATLWGAVAAFGPLGAYTLARIVEFLVQAGLWVLVSLSTALRVWRAGVAVAAALADALASPAVGMMLTATVLVSGLSLIALVRLLSAEQESSPW